MAGNYSALCLPFLSFLVRFGLPTGIRISVAIARLYHNSFQTIIGSLEMLIRTFARLSTPVGKRDAGSTRIRFPAASGNMPVAGMIQTACCASCLKEYKTASVLQTEAVFIFRDNVF
jgi:hypothetical protein